ncbi:ATP-binding protein [Carboxylicivirga sp. N1Y90]|uniref:sensor histidine kinase n=1 Tax=Carboxylicivirga fragile TaxID=3417571 RepID=UPI003D343D5A|nr:GHKL domain-containing protein [Marinilabiliaceae bacterium N1Y90]
MPHQKIRTFVLIAIILVLIGKISESVFDKEYIYASDVHSIQQSVLEKQNLLRHQLSNLKNITPENDTEIWSLMDSLSLSGTHFYLFQDSILKAWSTDKVPINSFQGLTEKHTLKKFANGWYLWDHIHIGEYQLLALSLLKEAYTYENKFLTNEFPSEIQLTNNPDISFNKEVNSNNIEDIHGNYLFSVIFNEMDNNISTTSTLSILMYFLSLILIIIAINKTLKKCCLYNYSNYLFIPIFLFLAILYLVFKSFAIPEDYQNTSLFSPSTFAVSDWLPSLGCLLIFGFLLLTWGVWFYRYFKEPTFISVNTKTSKLYYLGVFISTFLVLLFFLFINDLIYLLVRNSSQASIFFNIEDLNSIAVLKILILVLLFLAFSFVFEKTIATYKKHVSYGVFAIATILSFVLFYLLSFALSYDISLISLVLFLAIAGILYKAKRDSKNSITYSTFVLIIFLITLYLVFLLYRYNIKKEAENRELLIENLSFKLMREADPVAEMYLANMEDKLLNDEVLKQQLHQNTINEESIQDHLKKNYFHGYWQRYDMSATVCWPEVELITEDSVTLCYDYFNELSLAFGQDISQSKHFKYLDNDNGQISYFGQICYFKNDPNFETTIFIEIDSKPTFTGLGYPELLTSAQEQINLSVIKNYSFAKYINGNLVKQYGSFRYPIKEKSINLSDKTKSFYNEDHISHLVYAPNPETNIILSRPKVRVLHILMAFSTFFILFFFISSIILLLSRLKTKQSFFTFSIQERIQITFVGLMIMILVVMGVSSVYYSVYQFKQKNNQMLSQRIKSVLQEMEQKIVNEPELDEDMHEYLQYLLQKFSNVFYSDINLYSLEGKLLATSRPELYQKGLTGRMMNAEAFHELSLLKKAEYIHEESIGSLHFTSAYIPIFNYENEILAYLNLPYFVGNNELKSEVSSLIVAVINAYLLFVLFAIGLAVIVSRRITRPLMLIQDRLAQTRLGKQNKKIGYKGHDEIGNLVNEYNRMVDELTESAEKLAKSEREMAWREMAKQIAHEIKNPLTPMKLSVQYLLRAWDERQDFESYLKKVSNTLIEQIDQLHVIANEFSNFAKMPMPKRKKINIVNKLTNAISLFEQNEKNIHFQSDFESDTVYVFADRDQLLSTFNNILKNAVQAIPKDKEGNINITLSINEPNVKLSFSDNGRGMDDETIKKIFMPNFTTKSSGMGLGLSIVKNIVKNSGGEIWFETTKNIGTTFFIEFPIYSGE